MDERMNPADDSDTNGLVDGRDGGGGVGADALLYDEPSTGGMVVDLPTNEDGREVAEKGSLWPIVKYELSKPKWRLLVLLCLLPFGTYYIYDFPSSLGTGAGATIQVRFLDDGKEYTQEMNQAFYSVYSYPNTVLAFCGGILIDRLLGLRRSMMLFTLLVLAGSLLFFVGVQTISYPVMMCGRLLFGLGGESLSVSQSAYIFRWFGGQRGLSFAFGLTISCARIGSSFNFMFSTKIAEEHGVEMACLVGCMVCAFSTLCCAVLVISDFHFERKGVIKPQPMGDGEVTIGQRLRTMFAHIRRLPVQYWLLCGVCVSLYGSDFPFVGVAKNFFQVKFGQSATRASDALSYYQLTSAVASPVIGLIIDRLGRNAFVLAFASVAFFTSHLVMTVTNIDPVAAMVMLGVFYSTLVSSLWPSVPFVVSESLSGVAYGAMMSIQNMGSATIPLFTGAILDHYTPSIPPATTNTTANDLVAMPDEKGFIIVEIIMMGFALVSLLFCIALIIVDIKRTGGVLCTPPAVRAGLFEKFILLLDDALRNSANDRDSVLESDAFVDGDSGSDSHSIIGAEDVHVPSTSRHVEAGSAIYSPVASGGGDGRRTASSSGGPPRGGYGGAEDTADTTSYRNTASRFIEGPDCF